MCPQEELRIADLIDPPYRLAHDLVGRSLSRRRASGMLTHASIVIEALGEAAVGMQHIRTDERRRAEARSAEDLGKCQSVRGQCRARVVTHAVAGGRRPVKRLVCAGSVSGATDVA